MTVHAAPGAGLTTCCWRLPANLPDDDRITSNPAQVTCNRAATRMLAEKLARDIHARQPGWSVPVIADTVGLPVTHVRQLLDRR